MNINPEEKFNKDLRWVLSELKQEELANAFSEYKFEFTLSQDGANDPDIKSQRRIMKYLSDRKAVTLDPFYHSMHMFDKVLAMQGARPIGFYVQILQPTFNKVYEEILGEQPKVTTKVDSEPSPSPAPSEDDLYIISFTKDRHVVLNNTFILSNPNFMSENHKFIEYVVEHPDVELKRKEIEAATEPLKKNFHAILNDLGFRNELRKLFFEVSKTAIKFRNGVSVHELPDLGVDKNKLEIEISGLKIIDQK